MSGHEECDAHVDELKAEIKDLKKALNRLERVAGSGAESMIANMTEWGWAAA